MTGVLFRSKSPWQKPGCLFCESEATLEATAPCGGRGSAHIRCCGQPECRAAAQLLCETFLSNEEARHDGAN